MKVIFIILLFLRGAAANAQVPAKSQNTDTSLWKDTTIGSTYTYLRAYNSGMLISTAGLIGTCLSAMAWKGSENSKQVHTYGALTLASGFLTLIGTIITADAYCKLRSNKVYIKSTAGQVAIGVKF